MTVRVGINGFGRIGRNFFRAAKQRGADIDFVAVNDLGSLDTMAHLLKYDSVLGTLPDDDQGAPRTASRSTATTLKVLAERDPADLPWGDLGVDVVIESTGFFTDRDKAAAHLEARRAAASSCRPRRRRRRHVRVRRQPQGLRPRRRTRSSRTPAARPTASCRWSRCSTTRSASSNGLMTTVHAYTGDQQLVDGPHSDLRRARAAAINIVPTSTGAARATASCWSR